jgi:signal transduction histidine kinase
MQRVTSVDEDAEATLWVVMGNGFVARRLTSGWERLPSSDVWGGEDATCLVAEPRGGVWIGTRWNGLYHYQQGRFRRVDRPVGLASDYVRSLLVDRAGDLWIGLSGSNCVQRLSGGQFTTILLPPDSQPIRALTQDAGGAIWAGDTDGNIYSIRDDQVTEETERTLSPRRAIRCLQAAPEGGVLIGYARDGLGWLRSNRFVHLSVQSGLLQRDVSQILADANGDLWLGGNRGLSHLRRADWEAYVGAKTERLHTFTYGRHEGLSNLEASYGAAPAGVRSRDGRLWLATRSGLLEVNPSQAHFNPSPPPVFIEQVLVDQQPALIPRGALFCEETTRRQAGGGNANALHLPPEHRRLDLEFTALNFTAPELTRFQYKLDGYEEGWTEVGNERRVSYGRLPPGQYRFHVRAGNESNVWNESGATIALRVSPFFWQTWWFGLTAVALATLGIAFVVRRVSYRRLRLQMERLEREAMLNAERARIARDLHDDLGANLTQLALQSELAGEDLAQPERTAGQLDRLATRARDLIKTLDEIVWAANPRNDTFQDLLEYMGQFTSDFLASAGIRCRLDLPDQLSDRPVTGEDRHTLYLVVKEALHNVVKHAAASEVWLRVAETDEALVMSVEDNGKGVEPGKAVAWSDGLRNMRERLTAIGGTLELNSQPDQGTVVTIRFPWPKD